MCEIQLSCCHGGVEHICVNLDAFEHQGRYVWTTLQTIESEWDSYFFVGYNFFDLCSKCGNKQTWQNDYPLFLLQKLIFEWRNITLLSLFSALILKVKWTLVPLCVHERKCAWKKYEFIFGVPLKLFCNILIAVFLKLFHLFSHTIMSIVDMWLFGNINGLPSCSLMTP